MPQILHIPELQKPCRANVAAAPGLARRIALTVIIAGLLLTGLWFRVEHLGTVPGLNGDEAWSGVQAIRFLHGEAISWRTPTGNPLNVFFWGPLVALHAVFPPSIALLRSVSVASGILAIGLNYWLCRRTFDQRTAIISTLLLAVSPVMIAYSRFAWDASQTPLVSVLVIYASLAVGRSILTVCLTLAAAIVVHPTNLFLVPIAVAASLPLERVRVDRRITFAGIVAATAVLFALRGPGELQVFVVHLIRLFSGSTIYQFISGGVQPSDITLADLATPGVSCAAFVGIVSRWKETDDPRDFRLVVGTSAALAAFFVIAGPAGVQPHQERYALWCVAPLSLIAARGAAWVWDCARANPIPVELAICGYAAVLLGGFQRHYLDVFAQTGGNSHLAFRTGDIDPKQAGLARIESAVGNSGTATIVTQGWWTRLPMQYLAAGNPRLRIVATLPDDIRREQAWFVELAGSSEQLHLMESMPSSLAGHIRSACNDRAGRETVVIYSSPRNAADSLKKFVPARFDNEAN